MLASHNLLTAFEASRNSKSQLEIAPCPITVRLSCVRPIPLASPEGVQASPWRVCGHQKRGNRAASPNKLRSDHLYNFSLILGSAAPDGATQCRLHRKHAVKLHASQAPPQQLTGVCIHSAALGAPIESSLQRTSNCVVSPCTQRAYPAFLFRFLPLLSS